MDTVEEVVNQLGISIVNSGDEISAHCPFHKDAHPSFSINAESGLWICYQCGRAGNLDMLVSAVGDGANPKTVLRDLRFEAVQKLRHPVEVPEEELPLPDPLLVYARYESFKAPPEWAFEDRHISADVVERYGLKWDSGWIIPIWAPEMEDDWEGLWGWQFKRLDFVSNYPKQVKKSRTLFGLRELESTKSVVLVESPLDVARLASVGVSAVAAYGAMVSRAQLRLLIETAERIVLALDNDYEGERQMHKIYRYLAKQLPTQRAELPNWAKDPGDLNDKEARRVFQ